MSRANLFLHLKTLPSCFDFQIHGWNSEVTQLPWAHVPQRWHWWCVWETQGDEMRPMSWRVSPAAVGGWLNHGSRWNQPFFQNGGVWESLMVHDWDPKNEQSEVFFRNFSFAVSCDEVIIRCPKNTIRNACCMYVLCLHIFVIGFSSNPTLSTTCPQSLWPMSTVYLEHRDAHHVPGATSPSEAGNGGLKGCGFESWYIWVCSKIVGFPPKSSNLIGFSIVFTIHFGVPTPIFGNTHIELILIHHSNWVCGI